MTLKFIADVHISPLTVSELRLAGYDINRVSDLLSASISDNQIIEYAVQNDLIIITQDLDFSAIVAKNGLSKPSVISLRLGNVNPAIITKTLLSLIPQIQSELRTGAIISVEDDNFRIRKLPMQ